MLILYDHSRFLHLSNTCCTSLSKHLGLALLFSGSDGLRDLKAVGWRHSSRLYHCPCQECAPRKLARTASHCFHARCYRRTGLRRRTIGSHVYTCKPRRSSHHRIKPSTLAVVLRMSWPFTSSCRPGSSTNHQSTRSPNHREHRINAALRGVDKGNCFPSFPDMPP